MNTRQNFVVADIGGTHTRMALTHYLEDGAINLERVTIKATCEVDDLAKVIGMFATDCKISIVAAAVCAAGPMHQDGDPRIQLTNRKLSIGIADVKRELGVRHAVLVNDFVAQAAAVPALGEEHVVWHDRPDTLRAPCAVIGPGTGLGAAVWLGNTEVLQGEGGHVALYPSDDREAAVFPKLADEFGFVSAEDLLRGPALLTLYQELCELDGHPVTIDSPEAVCALALQGDPHATEVLRRFTATLGRVSGDFALCVGGRSILLAGGIVTGLGTLFDARLYRHHLTAKGRFSDYMKAIPSATLVHPYPALLGLTALARKSLSH